MMDEAATAAMQVAVALVTAESRYDDEAVRAVAATIEDPAPVLRALGRMGAVLVAMLGERIDLSAEQVLAGIGIAVAGQAEGL